MGLSSKGVSEGRVSNSARGQFVIGVHFCINKENRAQLSETVNSVLRWYQNVDILLCVF